MTLDKAKQTAWTFAGMQHQNMHVVQRGNQYFAASDLDLQRQFTGLTPIFTVKARGKRK
jgi:hypothetical protein